MAAVVSVAAAAGIASTPERGIPGGKSPIRTGLDFVTVSSQTQSWIESKYLNLFAAAVGQL